MKNVILRTAASSVDISCRYHRKQLMQHLQTVRLLYELCVLIVDFTYSLRTFNLTFYSSTQLLTGMKMYLPTGMAM